MAVVRPGLKLRGISYLYIITTSLQNEYSLYKNNDKIQACKIGYDSNPIKRRFDYQVHSPLKQSMEFIQPVLENDAKSIEEKIHNELNKYKIRGEWFNISYFRARRIVTDVLFNNGYSSFMLNTLPNTKWIHIDQNNSTDSQYSVNFSADIFIYRGADIINKRYDSKKYLVITVDDIIKKEKELIEFINNETKSNIYKNSNSQIFPNINKKTGEKFFFISQNTETFTNYLTKDKNTQIGKLLKNYNGYGGFTLQNKNVKFVNVLKYFQTKNYAKGELAYLKKTITHTKVLKNLEESFLYVNDLIKNKYS